MSQFGDQMTQILRGVDGLAMNGQWVGSAQAAAYDRAKSEHEFTIRIKGAGEQLAEAARKLAHALEFPRERLLGLATATETDGFLVSDDWKVEMQPTVLSAGDMAAKKQAGERWQAHIVQAVNDLDEADRAGVQLVRDSMRDLPTPSTLGHATLSPGIPGMPSLPPTDSGQAPHGSQPAYSRGDDLVFKKVAKQAANAADAKGWTHAAANIRHYLGNSGDDFNLDPDQMVRDVPAVQQLTNSMVNSEVQRIATEAAATGNYGQPVQFQTGWKDYLFSKETDPDWFYASGAVENSASGVVTVHPPVTAGGESRVTVDYQTYAFDRYNWDGGKSTEIAGVTVTDARMGALHTAGLAQEYNLVGSSAVRHYDGTLPLNGQLDLPGVPDNRDGTRTDPGRPTG